MTISTKILSSLFCAGLLAATTGSAKAESFYLTTDAGLGQSAPASTLCGTVTNCFGDIVLTQDGSNVDITATLTPGVHFVETGNTNSHETFAFNLPSTVTTSSIDLTNASTWSDGAGGTEAGIGTFSLYLYCGNTGSCGTPGNSTLSTLSFTVDGVTLSEFGTSAAEFAADVYYAGSTGNIDSGTPVNTPTPTPEPSSLMLLGTGIIGAAGLLRRRLSGRA